MHPSVEVVTVQYLTYFLQKKKRSFLLILREKDKLALGEIRQTVKAYNGQHLKGYQTKNFPLTISRIVDWLESSKWLPNLT